MGQMKLIRRKVSTFLFTLLSLAVISIFMTAPVPAMAAGTSISISPSSQSIENGDTFNVSLVINTDTASRGWQATVNYDTSKLIANSCTEGGFLHDWAIAHGDNTSDQSSGIDPAQGKINLAYIITGDTDPGGPSGSGALCTISFTAKQSVNSITGITLSNVIVSDIDAQQITGATTIGGLLRIGTITTTTSGGQTGSLHPLEVYVQNGSSGNPVLVHSYSQSEMESLAMSQPQYYSGIDSMPAAVQGKGIGVLLSTLLDSSGISFDQGASIKLYATDTEPNPYVTLTYDYLLGKQRYYYPNFTDVNNKNTDNAVAIDPMLCISSYQGRYLTRSQLDSYTMNASDSYRFCFGLLPSDVTGTTITANKFVKWVDRIDIILSDTYSITIDSDITGGTVTSNKSNAAEGDTVKLTVTPDSENRLKKDSLVVSYNGNHTVKLTAKADNVYTFTMPAYNVTVTAEFEDIPDTSSCTATFMSDGIIYTTISTTSGSTISAPAVPTKIDYSFAGWYSDESLMNAVIFPYKVMSNVTFYAKWTANTLTNYIITASAGTGGTISPSGNVTVNQHSSQAFTIVANAGYQIADVQVDGISQGAIPGYTFLDVTAGHSISAAFVIAQIPLITSFTPVSGETGSIVTITGNNFNGTTGVSFGGVAAQSFTVDSDTQITAIVGNGASGAIVVTTGGGLAIKDGFTFSTQTVSSQTITIQTIDTGTINTQTTSTSATSTWTDDIKWIIVTAIAGVAVLLLMIYVIRKK
jgi:uncharacterized repeat protein (TIGR02543 family)